MGIGISQASIIVRSNRVGGKKDNGDSGCASKYDGKQDDAS